MALALALALALAVSCWSITKTKVGIAMTATTLPSKGQVTVPKIVRDFLGIEPGSKVTFELTPRGDVLLPPAPGGAARRSPFAKVRGSATVRMRTDEIMKLTRGDQ